MDETEIIEVEEDKKVYLQRLKHLAIWLDDRIPIPGTNQRIGLDGIIGFIPIIGDVFTSVTALYILRVAWKLGVPMKILIKMIWNLGLDFFLGAVPLVGDLCDIYFKSNLKNVRLLIEYLEPPI